MAPASSPAKRGDELSSASDAPSSNWEVAYVYAFLFKFTNLRNLSSNATLLFTPMTLEEALLSSSPQPPKPLRLPSSRPAPSKLSKPSTSTSTTVVPGSPTSSLSSLSSLSDVDSLSSLSSDEEDEGDAPAPSTTDTSAAFSGPVPESSPLLVEIIKEFRRNVIGDADGGVGGGKKREKDVDWFGWLVRWVDAQFAEETEDNKNLSWTENLLKRQDGVKESNWWLLKWEQKIHLLRVLVDWQLAYSTSIRDMIAQSYDLGHQRVIKRDPKINPLTIEKVGSLGRGEVWQLDDSPRLYFLGNPMKYQTPWKPLSTTVEEYQAYFETLAKSTKEEEKAVEVEKLLAGPFKKAKEDAKKVSEKKKAKSKADDKESDDESVKKEKATRKVLEERLPMVLEGVQAIEAFAERKAKAIERAADRDARVARQLSRLGTGIATRERRLRTQTRRVDYTYDAGGEEEGGDDADYDQAADEAESSNAGGHGKFKRPRVVDSEEEEDSDDESQRSTRKSSRNGGSAAPEWRGERRSTRIRLRESESEEIEDDVDPSWTRAISTSLGGEETGSRQRSAAVEDPNFSSVAPSAQENSSSPSLISETGSSTPTEGDLETLSDPSEVVKSKKSKAFEGDVQDVAMEVSEV